MLKTSCINLSKSRKSDCISIIYSSNGRAIGFNIRKRISSADTMSTHPLQCSLKQSSLNICTALEKIHAHSLKKISFKIIILITSLTLLLKSKLRLKKCES